MHVLGLGACGSQAPVDYAGFAYARITPAAWGSGIRVNGERSERADSGVE